MTSAVLPSLHFATFRLISSSAAANAPSRHSLANSMAFRSPGSVRGRFAGLLPSPPPPPPPSPPPPTMRAAFDGMLRSSSEGHSSRRSYRSSASSSGSGYASEGSGEGGDSDSNHGGGSADDDSEDDDAPRRCWTSFTCGAEEPLGLWERCCCVRSESRRPGAGGIRRGGSTSSGLQWWKLKRVWKRLFSFTVLMVQIGLQFHFWFECTRHTRQEESSRWDMVWVVFHYWPSQVVWLANFISTMLPLSMWFVFEWMRTESSAAARQAGLVFLYFWLLQIANTCVTVYQTAFWDHVFGFMSEGRYLMTLLAVWWRVSMAESAFEARGASLGMAVVFWLDTGPILIKAWFMAFGHLPHFLSFASDSVYRTFALLVAAALSGWRLSTILRTLHSTKMSSAKRYLAAEVLWADFVLRRVRRSLVIVCVFGFIFVFLQGLTAYLLLEVRNSWIHVSDIPNNLYIIVEFFTLLDSVGFVNSKAPSMEMSQTSSVAQPEEFEAERSSLWMETVHSLAGRFMEAGELLKFYAELPESMPWYDPRRHTTNDIVRAAIIPLSHRAGRGWALANLSERSDAGGLLPERMVTHDWRNLFLHLVAAILADALGKDEYGAIASKLCLDGGPEVVRKNLEDSGAMHRRYWICAFCVNQHLGICGGFSPPPPADTPEFRRWEANRRDSVSGDLHTCCRCIEPKFFLDAPDECEMNKFDDMMALLNHEAPDFRQLIAIDRHFDVFTRVWCVAELVQAHRAQIPQNVCLMSKKALDPDIGDLGIYIKLANLTVADCSATFSEDKDAILRKISDIPEFDAHLQAAIFGSSGLLGRELVGFDVLYTAARTALRVKAAARQRRSPSTTARRR
mmetsp:Transcript_6578/g.20151  ORF Transcript_6578/g.20151 Transcript_6578/m.20151 type:complete len:851 (+) Transcript_6578:434-2986(+)